MQDLHTIGACARIKAYTNVESAESHIDIVKAQPGKNGSYAYYRNGVVSVQDIISAPAKMQLSFTESGCSGYAQRPDVTAVYDAAGNVIHPNNYTIAYSNSNSAAPGTYSVTVNFVGAKYTGTLSQNYTLKIYPITTLKTVSSSTDTLEISWNESSGAEGYYVYMATSKGGTYKKIATLTGSATTSCIIDEDLSAAKNYYFKIQPYSGSYKGEMSAILYSATKPKKVSGLKKVSQSTSSVKLSWKKVSGASGYDIQRYNSSKKKWETIKTVDNSTLSYTNKKLKAGTTYKYRVRAYRKNGSYYANGSASSTLSVSTKPAQVKSLKNSSSTTTSIKIKWAKVTGASSYQIYQYDSAKKKWKKIATVSGSKTSYTQKKLKEATSYKYKVRAYRKSNGETLYGSYSSVLTTSTAPAKVKSLQASSIGKTSLKLSWKKVTGASGYEIYQYNTAKKKYVKAATITKGKTVSKKLTKLKKKTTYKFKVRAYRKVSGVTYYGSFSSVKQVKTK